MHNPPRRKPCLRLCLCTQAATLVMGEVHRQARQLRPNISFSYGDGAGVDRRHQQHVRRFAAAVTAVAQQATTTNNVRAVNRRGMYVIMVWGLSECESWSG
jgi:hypothetical protein